MNKKQKNFVIRLAIVAIVTTLMVLAISNFKEVINRSEATMATEQLGGLVKKKKNHYGSFPPASYLENLTAQVQGSARLGTVVYRADCITCSSGAKAVLMFVKKEYSGLLQNDGFIVVRLDGSIEWLNPDKFEIEMSLENRSCEITLSKLGKVQDANEPVK